MNVTKVAILIVSAAAYAAAWSAYGDLTLKQRVTEHVNQMNDDGATGGQLRAVHNGTNALYLAGWLVWGAVAGGLLWPEVKAMLTKSKRVMVPALMLVMLTGCWRPFEPVKLETIGANEEGFLIPLVGDSKEQASTHSEDFLAKNLVHTKQVKVPQQWVQKGYEYLGANGEWRDAATLITVDRSPITREWTADPATGTSNKNEAVWVMTSDQVEFSTGWTCTAYIATRHDAVKFLYFYPAGSIAKVMDEEVRSKIQTVFGLETTDEPMSKLRTAATPHIQHTVENVTKFFHERGLTISNLGITGGFIYKDKSIQDTLVKLFNAEQEQAIAEAEAAALQKMAGGQADAAKLKATGEAEATKLKAEAEASAIKTVADSKAYEIEKATGDLETYLRLKQLEVEKTKIEKWSGRFPTVFIGQSPEAMLKLPVAAK
jgi:regulator of protease activity HflC (stomatin/prohibitin superfamily)